MNDQEARNAWDATIQAERDHQREKGYTPDHDDEHGLDHLLRWAQDYIRCTKRVEAAALIEAAREKLIRDRAKAEDAALIAESKLSELTAHSPEWWAVHDVAQNIRAASDSARADS